MNGSSIIDHINTVVASGWAAAVAGRLAWHSRLAQKGERKFFSRELLFEIPIVFFGYLIGYGAASAFGWTGAAVNGAIAVAAYMGPGGLQAFAQWYVRSGGKAAS